jgi:hypothetical protein
VTRERDRSRIYGAFAAAQWRSGRAAVKPIGADTATWLSEIAAAARELGIDVNVRYDDDKRLVAEVFGEPARGAVSGVRTMTTFLVLRQGSALERGDR